MSPTVVLRFRDLVTEPGGTIREHRRILSEQGYVWWGWWMRQYELPPIPLFKGLLAAIENHGVEQKAFLFDSGQELVWSCAIADLQVAPPDQTLGPPELDKAPSYYQRGMYPAWFKLSDIAAEPLDSALAGWRFAEFPTNPQRQQHQDLQNTPITSLSQLRESDATLWLIDQQ